MAGQAAPDQAVLDALVAGDWDPEAYDAAMAAAFGDDYYEVGLFSPFFCRVLHFWASLLIADRV